MDLVERWRISVISNTFGELCSREKGISDLQLTYTCLFCCCDFRLIILLEVYFTDLLLKGSFDSKDQTCFLTKK